MNPNLPILIFSIACVPFFAIIFVFKNDGPNRGGVAKVFKFLFCSAIIASMLVALPIYIINQFVLSKTFYYADPDYRAAKEMEVKTKPGLNIKWPLEPPLPVFWPFPVISKIESGAHLAAIQQMKMTLKAGTFKRPGYVILSFFISLVVYSPFLAGLSIGIAKSQ